MIYMIYIHSLSFFIQHLRSTRYMHRCSCSTFMHVPHITTHRHILTRTHRRVLERISSPVVLRHFAQNIPRLHWFIHTAQVRESGWPILWRGCVTPYVYIYLYIYNIWEFWGVWQWCIRRNPALRIVFLRVSPPWEKIFTPLSSS